LGLFCQEPVSIDLTHKDGLPDIEFYDIIEDDNGFIWLAANKGLYRFDGKEHKLFSIPEKRGLSVFNLQKDNEGKVWCNNLSGQFFYIDNNQMFLFFDIRGNIGSNRLPQYTITEKYLKISTDKGIFFVERESKKIVRKKEFLNKGNYTYQLTQNPNKLYILRDSLEIINDNFKSKKYTLNYNYKYYEYKKLFNVEGKIYAYISEIKYRKGWVGAKGAKLHFFDGEKVQKNNLIPKELIFKTIIDIHKFNDEFWFSTSSGLYIFKQEKNKFKLINTVFKGEYITSTIKDKNNNFWVTTLNKGIHIIPDKHIKRTIPFHTSGTINSFIKIKDNFIYATDFGEIILLNKKTNSIITFKDSVNINEIRNLYFNKSKGEIIIATYRGNYLWNLKKGTYSLMYRTDYIKQLSFYKDGSFLLSSPYNLTKYFRENVLENKNKTFLNFEYENNTNDVYYKRKKIIENDRSYGHFISKNQDTYSNKLDKLILYDSVYNPYEIRYKSEPIQATSFTETKNGVVWVSTINKGILQIKSKDDVYPISNNSFDFQKNKASKLFADGNNLLAVTDIGIVYLKTNSNFHKFYSFKNKIPAQKVFDIDIYDNKLQICTDAGIFIIDKKGLEENISIPKVYFEEIFIGNKKFEEKKQYAVNHKNNSLKVSFNINGLGSLENTSYYYRLNGLEKKWKKTDLGSVSYYALPYKSFVFEVKAFSNNGLESEVETIKITIKKPFWNTWWFYSLIALIFIISVATIFFRIRKKQLKDLKNERIAKELVLTQLKNLRAQMNPHFIFNVLNSIQEYIISKDKYTASFYLAEFSSLIRMYLEHSSKENITLLEEIKALELYLNLEKNRFGKDFKFKITIDKKLNTTGLLVPPVFIQPYVENAIKHGLLHKSSEKILLIDFKMNRVENTLVCEILDNGIGRQKSNEINKKNKPHHQSFATQANMNRVLLLNKSRKKKVFIEIEDIYERGQPKGTKIIIKIQQ
jgi:ligand-binding sensor domain-containing protein